MDYLRGGVRRRSVKRSRAMGVVAKAMAQGRQLIEGAAARLMATLRLGKTLENRGALDG